ncbi:uncharacterized protein LOC131231263 [Magnolia sinica]|uniref:uncharacterized protein LOC131231263 n=1 Tax=Magnolia sinica TaxID=86752 RepID=UPI00265A2372|nr:uncharacterized protein LOC131231263 [Magnolia sinica]
MALQGTVLFSTVGRCFFGFDIFSVTLPSNLDAVHELTERRLTDGKSVNFNGQFLDEPETVVFVSERTGEPRIYLTQPENRIPSQIPTVPESHFLDRPVIKDGRLYFVSAHEKIDKLLSIRTAVYTAGIEDGNITRLTPYGAADYSPSVSRTGKFVAVASYGHRQWGGSVQDPDTDIVVFRPSDPEKRTVICKRGGWPTWSGDSTVFFHRKSEDGWWSVFRADLPENLSGEPVEPRRITPPGLHAFTPAASNDGKRIAVATRRPGTESRHVEIFDLETESFHRVSELLNPEFDHYNPFFSPESGFLGYHRFRGKSDSGELTIPHLEPVISPVKDLRLLRLNGNMASFTPDGKLIVYNPDFDIGLDRYSGVMIVRSDGSKRWTVMKNRIAFATAWSPTEKGVIYTSLGMIFQGNRSTVQIARISFDPAHLDDDHDEIAADVKILTREETGNNAFPSVSPDGKHIVFRSGRNGHRNLYIMDVVDGEFNGGIRQLTDGPWIDTMPSWSPDGKLIAFSSNRHNPRSPVGFSIYLIRPDGTELRRVHVAGPEGSDEVNGERFNHVAFSADSTWLVFAGNLAGLSAEPISMPNQFQPYGDIYVSRLDGSGLERLTWTAYENGVPAWHPYGEAEMGPISLDVADADELRGQFEEPKWLP